MILQRSWLNSCFVFYPAAECDLTGSGAEPMEKGGALPSPLPEPSPYISPRHGAPGAHLDGERRHTCRQEKLPFESTTKISPLPKALVALERVGTTESRTLREFIYVWLAGGLRHLLTSLFNPCGMEKSKFKARKGELGNLLEFQLWNLVKSQLFLHAVMRFPDECTLFLHWSICIWWLSCFSSQKVRDQILS